MSIMDHIKAGFAVAHRVWLLIFVHMGVMLANGLLFLFIVGLPIVIALVVMGFDPGELKKFEHLLDSSVDPVEMVSSYVGLILLFMLVLFAYITIALGVSFYTFSATVGVIGRAVEDKAYVFSMSSFFKEGNRLFWRMTWYMTIVALIASFVFIAFMVAVVVASMASVAVGLSDSSLEIFFKVLFFMCLGMAALVSFVAIYSLTLQGLAPMALQDMGAYKSFKRAFVFLEDDLRGLGLMALIITAMMVVQTVMVTMGMVLQAIPLIGFLISIPMQFVYKAIGTYMNMVVIAVAIGYYYNITYPAVPQESDTIEYDPSLSDTSTTVPDTSAEEALWPPPAPSGREDRQSD